MKKIISKIYEKYVLSTYATVILCFIIIVSIIPYESFIHGNFLNFVNLFFLCAFSIDFLIRFLIFFFLEQGKYKNNKSTLFFSFALLIIDFFATLSFIPSLFIRLRFIRVIRLIRILRIIKLFSTFRYYFKDIFVMIRGDKILSKINFIIITSLGLILIGAGIFTMDPRKSSSFFKGLWKAFMLIQDQGNLKDFDSLQLSFIPSFENISELSFSIILTLMGMLFFSILIGLMANVIERVMEYDDFSKLRFTDHTIIANWDDNYDYLLNEISDYRSIEREKLRGLAIENSKNNKIILLSREKIKSINLYSYPNIKIHRRYGLLFKNKTKNIINFNHANKVIILSPNQDESVNKDTEMSDLISLVSFKKEKKNDMKIIFEVKKGYYYESLQDIRRSSSLDLEIVYTPKTINQIITQCLGNPYIIDIYKELLSYQGNDLYLKSLGHEDEREWNNARSSVKSLTKNEKTIAFFDNNGPDSFLFSPSPPKDDMDIYRLMIGNFQINSQNSRIETITTRHLVSSHDQILIIGYNDSIFDMIYELSFLKHANHTIEISIYLQNWGFNDMEEFIKLLKKYYKRRDDVPRENTARALGLDLSIEKFNYHKNHLINIELGDNSLEEKIKINVFNSDFTNLLEMESELNRFENTNIDDVILLKDNRITDQDSDHFVSIVFFNLVKYFKSTSNIPAIYLSLFSNETTTNIENILSSDYYKNISPHVFIIDETFFLSKFISLQLFIKHGEKIWNNLFSFSGDYFSIIPCNIKKQIPLLKQENFENYIIPHLNKNQSLIGLVLQGDDQYERMVLLPNEELMKNHITLDKIKFLIVLMKK